MQNRDRGDILIRGFWANGTDCIIDIRTTDTDAPSYVINDIDPMTVISNQEKEKKRKYLEACTLQRRHCTPFVFSIDGVIGLEEKIIS